MKKLNLSTVLVTSALFASIAGTSFAGSDIGPRDRGVGHDVNAGTERVDPNVGAGRSSDLGPRDKGVGHDVNVGTDRVDPNVGVGR